MKRRGLLIISGIFLTLSLLVFADEKANSDATLKKVLLKIDISFDIAAQDPDIPYRITLEEENTKLVTHVNHNDEISPGNYILKIERPGYETLVERQTIAPQTCFVIERCLKASMRKIITRITKDYPEGVSLFVDKMTISHKPLTLNSRIKPGIHEFAIFKYGYYPMHGSIRILASDKPFLLERQLRVRPRPLVLRFLSSYHNQNLTPKKVIIDEKTFSNSKLPSLKPGIYRLRVRIPGYVSLDEMIIIPPGEGPFEILQSMKEI